MISSYDLTLKSADGAFIPYDCAYRLYSWLLSSLPEEAGDALHEQGGHPVSQYLCSEREGGIARWHISLLNDTAHELFTKTLESTKTIRLNGMSLSVDAVRHTPPITPAELIRTGRLGDSCLTVLKLITPTAFKQSGCYVIFPQEKLIVQSLARSWSLFCPEFLMDDPDALQMLADGLRITDYSLHSTRYKMKNAYVPGFAGRITIFPRLSVPMLELWNILLVWSEYAGIGIKTTLGMGGVSLGHSELRE